MNSGKYKDESELVKDLVLGSAVGFDELFRKYAPQIHLFARSMLKSNEEAEEVVQNTFLRLWHKRGCIDSSQSFKSFLFSIAYNITMDVFRVKMRDKKYRDYVLMTSTSFYDPEQSFFLKELYQNLDNLVEELPEKRKEIFRLRQGKGLSYKEISEQLDVPVKTVENNINLAIKYIKDHLPKDSFIILTGILFYF